MIGGNEYKQNLYQLQIYVDTREDFCHLSVQKITELEAFASTLQKIAIRWMESKCRCLIESDMMMFKTSLEEIKKISDTVEGTSACLKKLTESAIGSINFSSEDILLNTLLLSFVINTNDDRIAAQSFMSVTASLKNSIRLLSHQTSSRYSQFGKRGSFGFKLLFAGLALLNESAKKAREIIDHVLSEEVERQELNIKIQVEALEQSKKLRLPPGASSYVV